MGGQIAVPCDFDFFRDATIGRTLNAPDASLIEELQPINKNAGRVSLAAFPIARIRHLPAERL